MSMMTFNPGIDVSTVDGLSSRFQGNFTVSWICWPVLGRIYAAESVSMTLEAGVHPVLFAHATYSSERVIPLSVSRSQKSVSSGDRSTRSRVPLSRLPLAVRVWGPVQDFVLQYIVYTWVPGVRLWLLRSGAGWTMQRVARAVLRRSV